MRLTDSLRLGLVAGQPDVVALVGGGGKSSAMFCLGREIADAGRRVVLTTTTQIAVHEKGRIPAVVRRSGEEFPWQSLETALAEHNQCLYLGYRADRIPKRSTGSSWDKHNSEVDKISGLTPDEVDELCDHAERLELSAIVVEADGSRQLPVKAPANHEPALPRSALNRRGVVVTVAGVNGVGLTVDGESVHRPELIRRILGVAERASLRLTPAQLANLLVHEHGGAKGIPPNVRHVILLNQADTLLQLVVARLVARNVTVHSSIPVLIGAVGEHPDDPVNERWGSVAAIVLAAGASHRMGKAKQLLAVDGEPLVVRAARAALDSGASPVVVVTGAESDRVADALAPLRAQANARLHSVYNPEWASGQATSMHAGLRVLQTHGGCDAAIFMPVDQPRLASPLLRRQVTAWRRGAQIVAPAVEGTIRGAPALFDRHFWPGLFAIHGDVGGRELLRQHRAAVVSVTAAEEELWDVDTPDDYRRVS